MKTYSSIKSLQNNNGFAMIIIMALLPITIGGLFMTFSAISFIRTDQKMKYICRTTSMKGQYKVAPLLKTLIGMNPIAVRLQVELAAAQALSATGDPASIRHLMKVQEKIATFQLKQEQLIKQSNILLFSANAHTYSLLWNEKEYIKSSVPLFTGDLQVSFKKAPKLAVHPIGPYVPPTYSLDENFQEKQALAQHWLYSLSVLDHLHPFLGGTFKFDKSCSVTLREEEKKWVPLIIVDKF